MVPTQHRLPRLRIGRAGLERDVYGPVRQCACALKRTFWMIRQIAALPEAVGEHACECGHPEMRLPPDGDYRCPACGSEVLPSEPTYYEGFTTMIDTKSLTKLDKEEPGSRSAARLRGLARLRTRPPVRRGR